MLQYFLEFKNRCLLILISCCFIIFTAYIYKEILLFLIVQNINKLSFLNISYFIFTDVVEIFSVYIKLINFISLQIMIIYSLYHLFLFLIPALYKQEYIFLNLLLKSLFFSWFISAYISTQLLIPLTWNFFLSFQDLIIKTTSLNIHFESKIIEYFNFYIYFYTISFFYFQISILLLLLFNYSNINLYKIKKYRKLYYFSFIFTATFLSPDVTTQVTLLFIFIFSYEIFIIFFIFFKKLLR